MANRDGNESYIHHAFPAGSYNVFVRQGSLLGYQVDYNPPFPIAMHLHMSIVTSAEDGSFKNEAVLANKLDSSLYFGLQLEADNNPGRPV